MGRTDHHFSYQPGTIGRFMDRHFPKRGLANRQAALQSYMFDTVTTTKGFQSSLSRFAAGYDLLSGDRTRHGYIKGLAGTGDVHNTEEALADARETARDAARTDPIVEGLLQTYVEGVVGSELPIEARSTDEKWNKDREALWKETMLERPCEITGRFNFIKSIYLAILSAVRDGDCFTRFTGDDPWIIEGEQVGTPNGISAGGKYFNVFNGVATDKTTGRVIGYYVGKPNKWGYIEPKSFNRYTADQVHHIVDIDRISYTRGVPMLTSAIQWFDKFGRYADAELATSIVQACQGVAITRKSPETPFPGAPPMDDPAKESVHDNMKRLKMSPGMIWDLDTDEDVKPIGSTRPTSVFGEFMNKCLTIAGRGAGIPLMLITQDLSGATFMNARIASQMAQERWRRIQAFVVKPLASRWYLWKTANDIASGALAPAPDDWRLHEVFCRRWPYVDPEKEAKAQRIELENGTTTQIAICAQKGQDYRQVIRDRVRQQQIEDEEGWTLIATESAKQDDNDEQ